MRYFSPLAPYRSAVLLHLYLGALFLASCSLLFCRSAELVFGRTIPRRSLPIICLTSRSGSIARIFPLHSRIYISTRSIICQNGIFYMRLRDPARLAACISARMVSLAPPTAYSLMRSTLGYIDYISLCAIATSTLRSSVLDLLITHPAFPNRLNSFFCRK